LTTFALSGSAYFGSAASARSCAKHIFMVGNAVLPHNWSLRQRQAAVR
jgi:hypothetical protein